MADGADALAAAGGAALTEQRRGLRDHRVARRRPDPARGVDCRGGARHGRPAHVRAQGPQAHLRGPAGHGRAARRRSRSATPSLGDAPRRRHGPLRGGRPSELGLSDEEMTPLLQAAALHDVGKVAIPDAILDKPGPLDEAEWEFMRTHTLIGERILAEAPSLAEAAKIVRSSHERYDGTGYPDGLAGEADPACGADHRRLRLLRRDDLEPPLPDRDERGGRAVGAPQRARARSSTPRSSRRSSRRWARRSQQAVARCPSGHPLLVCAGLFPKGKSK